MKKNLILIYLVFLFLLSCKYDAKVSKTTISTEKEVHFVENTNKTEQKNEIYNCSVDDFLLLRKKNIQKDFFKKVDSVFTIQYPNKKDRENSINITQKILNTYLNDINEQSLRDSVVVFKDITLAEKEYHFKFIPKNFNQWKTSGYKNIIYIRYNPKDCGFGLYINYSCIIHLEDEDEDVAEEHLISYHFRIINGKIVEFGRNEAG